MDLSITGPDAYNISNAQPRLNQNVTFTITIRNVGTAAVPSASITFLLYADGTPVGAPRQISFSMAGGSGCTARVTWTATLPRKGRSMQLATSVIANGDVNTANNSNRWSFPAAR